MLLNQCDRSMLNAEWKTTGRSAPSPKLFSAWLQVI
jgi:hypothetical protein